MDTEDFAREKARAAQTALLDLERLKADMAQYAVAADELLVEASGLHTALEAQRTQNGDRKEATLRALIDQEAAREQGTAWRDAGQLLDLLLADSAATRERETALADAVGAFALTVNCYLDTVAAALQANQRALATGADAALAAMAQHAPRA